MHGECTPIKSVTSILYSVASSPLAYPTDSTILLVTSYLPIKTLVSRQQSTSSFASVQLLGVLLKDTQHVGNTLKYLTTHVKTHSM